LTANLIDGRVYLRAIRGPLIVDLTFTPPDTFEALWNRALDIEGVRVLSRDDLGRQLEKAGRPRDLARARALAREEEGG